MADKCWHLYPVDEEKLQKAKHALLCMQRHSWEHGVTMQAFLEAGDMETVVLLAQEAAYRASVDGRPALIAYPNAVTDPCSVGEALKAACKTAGDSFLKESLEKLKVWMFEQAPRNQEGILYHLDNSPQFWVDSTYMLPPVMAALGNPEEGIRQMEGYWNALYDPSTGLMKHIWNDETQSFDRGVCWGVGNGWALAGLARLIDLIPEELAVQKMQIIEKATLLLTNVMRYRCEGGFHDIVDNPESFVEVNLAQMVSYTIYRGILSGWLSMENWLETAEDLRCLCEQHLDTFGIIRDVCGAPDFNAPGIAPEAQAFYIMMEEAAKKVANALEKQ